MTTRMKLGILVNLLFVLSINSALSFEKVSVPASGYHNLFRDNYSKILFTDASRGVYSYDLKDKCVKEIVESNSLVDSICAYDENILIIYMKSCVCKLSILKNGTQEEIIYSFPFRESDLFYPAIDPLNRKIALIETKPLVDRTNKTVKDIRSNLIIINIANRSKKSVAQINIPFPVIAWNNSGDSLYYFNKVNEKSDLCVWDDKVELSNILKKMGGVSIYYLYPSLISERYILFLAENSSGVPILGKLDIKSLRIDLKEVDSKDYGLIMFISFTSDDRFIYQTVNRTSEDKHSKVYISDINLNSKLILKDHSESLIPIGYNKVLDGLVFFRNQKEIISINLNDPSKQKVLYAIPSKTP